MSKVKLGEVAALQNGDRQSVIDTLERLIEEARDGRIISVAVAIVRPGLEMSHTWSAGNTLLMTAATVALQRNLLEDD